MEIELSLGIAESLFGLMVWAGAVYLYVDYRRSGEGGFKRFAAFWVGFPATFGCLLCVREGSRKERKELSVEQEETILREEIRHSLDARGDGPAGPSETRRPG